jgi:protein-L-isoaspartate(D-aspartate) O-methyltransferase
VAAFLLSGVLVRAGAGAGAESAPAAEPGPEPAIGSPPAVTDADPALPVLTPEREIALAERAEDLDLLIDLLAGEIGDRRVLDAMRRVPRHRFVPDRLRGRAYENRPLPIGEGQTISQPLIVALMTHLLDLDRDDRVLEIGTGSGYQAAVLAELAGEVFSIEIVEPLGKQAAEVLAELGYGGIRLRIGDGYLGWPESAPFDAIIVTCAPDHVPGPLREQLAEGGRLVIPVGEAGTVQQLILEEKREGRLIRREVLDVRFVPMTGEGVERGSVAADG